MSKQLPETLRRVIQIPVTPPLATMSFHTDDGRVVEVPLTKAA